MYWFDGKFHDTSNLTIACDDPALLYGATVFTTLRVYEHSLDHPLTLWGDHCDRIRHTIQHLHWPQPHWARLRQGAETMAHHFLTLRITCFPDGREMITGRALPAGLKQRQTQGIRAWVANSEDFRRPLANFKTGNYLGGWLSLQAAQRQDCQEAILVNDQHHWLETSTGNLWGWHQGQWWTPPLDAGILPGLMRRFLSQHLHKKGMPEQRVPWTKDLVQQFETLAYSNAVVQLIPIHTVITEQSRLEYNPEHAALEELRAAFAEV
jgi:branched-subunit amino acid aminotransferase/4-amino-4-deoxychorismate lyase